ncbi:MAG: hypothetical protein JW745_07810 [Sedimentisphaerales bacterium]|nr:hypothetical protein [Sedimentisphaerales bacterium]MBN2841785.1 hypothetical protein [Sedimentisphaerales bacterium]
MFVFRMLAALFLGIMLSGCGNTIREDLAGNFQRVVMSQSTDRTRLLIENVLRSFYSPVNQGKTDFILVGGPQRYTDPVSGRIGRETCTIAFLDQGDQREVFVQVKKEIPDFKMMGMHAQAGYNNDGHMPATPMESGMNLSPSRQVVWRNVGRDFTKERLILDHINRSYGSSEANIQN